MQAKSIEVIIPLYNEMEVVDQLLERTVNSCRQTGLHWRVILVDDGSTDGTDGRISELMERGVGDGNIVLVKLSRNFGQQAAIMAGLELAADSDCVVVMDGDLQDPPELIPRMVEKWNQGDQVVIPQKNSRQETPIRSVCFWAFHKLFRFVSDINVPPRTGNFCLLDRCAADAMVRLREQHRFFPGLRALIGFRQTTVAFERPARAAGKPKQSLRRLFQYAGDAFVGFSDKPMKLLGLTGFGLLTVGALLLGVLMVSVVGSTEAVDFWPKLIACGILLLTGVQLIGLGVVGAWSRRILDEARGRPAFVVQSVTAAGSVESKDSFASASAVVPFSEQRDAA